MSMSALTIQDGKGAGGGAIDNEYGSVDLTSDTFTSNSASRGGAVYSLGSGSTTVERSTFIGNSATNYGGAIYSAGGGSVVLSGNTLSGNNGGAQGGGVFAGGPLTVSNSSFSANTATHGGGIDINGGSSGPWVVDASTFTANTASAGGAIDNEAWGSALTVWNSALGGNSAVLGGGIYNSNGCNVGGSGGGTVVSFVTLWANQSSDGPAGGVYNGCGSLSLTGTIVAGSNGDPANGHSCGGAITDDGYNLSDDGSCGFTSGTSLSNVSAGLDPSGLQDNGGLTQTIALEPGSPAIGHVVDPSLCSGTDQRGMGRVVPCDIGSFQTGANPCAGSSTGQSWSSNQNGDTAYLTTCSGSIVATVHNRFGVDLGPFIVGTGSPPISVGIDNAGDVIAVWLGSNGALYEATKVADRPFAQPLQLAPPGGTISPEETSSNPSNVRLTVDPSSGNLLAVWTVSGTTCFPHLGFPVCLPWQYGGVYMSTIAGVSSAFQVTAPVGADYQNNASFNAIAINPDSALVAEVLNGTDYELSSQQLTSGGSSWQQGPNIDPCGTLDQFAVCTITSPVDLSVDTTGNIAAQWSETGQRTSSEVFGTLTPGANAFSYENRNLTQSVVFTSVPPFNPIVGDPRYLVTALGGGSGNPITFSSATPAVCGVSDAAVTFVANGTCTVNADQAGNSTYQAAPEVQQTFYVGKRSQTIAFTSSAPTDAVAGGLTYTPIAAGGASGNPVSITIDVASSAVCKISGGIVSFMGIGTCTLDANQAGDATYLAAPQVQQSFAVANMAITTTSLPDGSVREPYSTALAATGGNAPYKWSLQSGTLPYGLHFTATGIVKGKPKASGSFTFTLQVLDHRTMTHAQESATQTFTLTVSQPPPAITLVHPNTGPITGGTTVRIKGAAFWGASSVTFGGVPATGVTVNAAGPSITAIAPAEAAGSVDIVITTPGGVSATTAADVFTYS
jgi:predicted outer membrane repeat protein